MIQGFLDEPNSCTIFWQWVARPLEALPSKCKQEAMRLPGGDDTLEQAFFWLGSRVEKAGVGFRVCVNLGPETTKPSNILQQRLT